MNIHSELLAGDHIRHGLNRDLGFSEEDRHENIRRIAEVSRLLQDAGLIVLTAFISPFREDRKKAREIVNPGDFIEVFLKCPLPECERRDPKGIYKRAKRGDIKEFTGISSPYEEPEGPEIILETDKTSPSACVEKILPYLFENGYFNK
jgi:adenylylsulfate kinase